MDEITTMKGLLPLVRRPSRYIGGEVNSIVKELDGRLKFALAFPDAYELGMSHLGFQVLYSVLNNVDSIACERVFAPWTDMEALLREHSIPLSTLESEIPLSKCDIIGFSLQYELSYTNILNMLELGGVALRTAERAERAPFVIAGGPVAFNVEPMADFFDAVLLGDGERAVVEISEAVMESRAAGELRAETLLRLSKIPGVYVPYFFEVSYNEDNTVKEVRPKVAGYTGILKRTEPDIECLPIPTSPIVPFAETVHDRVSIEIMRGCTRGCRFCQAGMIYRPARERSVEMISSTVETELKNTGYDEASLLSLSTGDYTEIEPLLTGLMCGLSKEHVSMSLPSLRVGTLSKTLATEIARVRKTGFTIAPEAGTERLRMVINKGISEADLITTAETVFSLGWRAIKLYFMVGLPTETEEDLLGIVNLGAKVRQAGKRVMNGAPQVSVSVTTFIPKPFTPFQWAPQMELGRCKEVHAVLRKRLRSSGLDFKWNDPGASLLEGVFSRGDRRLSAVIERAFKNGARFDGWSEELKVSVWEEAFRAEAIDPEFYTVRERSLDETLPWAHLSPGVTDEFLKSEYYKALGVSSTEGVSSAEGVNIEAASANSESTEGAEAGSKSPCGEQTPDCKVDICTLCGVCDFKVIKNVLAPAVSAGGGEKSVPTDSEASPELPLRYTVRYSRLGNLRFLGHLELASVIKRNIKRAGLPIIYSKGFHPMQRLSFPDPLPAGIESLDESFGMELDGANGRLSPDMILERLNRAAPDGIKFLKVVSTDLKLSRASGSMEAAEYTILLKEAPKGLKIDLKRIDRYLRDFAGKDAVILSIAKKDKVKEVDMKQLVSELRLVDEGNLRFVLKKGQGASLRPSDVLVHFFNFSPVETLLIPILKTRSITIN
jgi:radical SAM family uncharacterized protein/radical SAM-linked protein